MPVSPQQTQKYRLQHIFGVGGITGNPICRPKHEPVASFEDALNLAGHRNWPILSNREFQRPSCLSPLKTGFRLDYYRVGSFLQMTLKERRKARR
jgi:hypothetical protein